MPAIINWIDNPPTGTHGATGSALALAEPEQIKNAAGKLWHIVCVLPGSLTLLDGNSGEGETLLPPTMMIAGQIMSFDGFPFFTGLYASEVTGTFNLSFA